MKLSFRKLYETLKKPDFLASIYEEMVELHKLTERAYNDATTAFFEHDKELAKQVMDNDEKIDKFQRDIRKKVLEYLAVSIAPNFSSSLTIISIVIDYERIGDIAENIAQLVYDYDIELGNDEYRRDVESMHDLITQNFTFSLKAFTEENVPLAFRVINRHNKVKKIHYKMTKKLLEDEKTKVCEGIALGLMGGFLRRINAHINNIITCVVQPFPKIGFEP